MQRDRDYLLIDVDRKRPVGFTVQIFSTWDAFHNKPCARYSRWVRAYGQSGAKAVSTLHLGPYEAIGKVVRCG